MKLPHGSKAIVDPVKLTDYCLSETHLRGRHKARKFAAALGLTAAHSEWLRQQLLEQAATADAVPTSADEFGRRFVIDFEVEGPSGSAVVRSCWIVRTGEGFPRLTSCYVR